MKKFISVLLCIFITLSIIGCTSQNVLEDSYENKIYLAELTEDQKNIINLIGIESDINIYKYEIQDTYKSISIWIETYENGELISSGSGTDSQIDLKEGKIAVLVDKASNYKWRVSLQDAGGLSSYSFETKNDFETNNKFSVSSGGLSQPVEITPEKEIVLDKFLFEDGNGISVYNNQYYVKNPKVLKQYDYVYLLKCKFSKKTIDEIIGEEYKIYGWQLTTENEELSKQGLTISCFFDIYENSFK
jgi:hypothetical protein